MAQQLPLIVGFGGINAAGRASSHHAYRRIILDKLTQPERTETLLSLATLMGLTEFDNGLYRNQAGESVSADALIEDIQQQIIDNTLIRRIQPDCFDVEKVLFNKPASMSNEAGQFNFQLRKRQLPQTIPDNWQVTESSPGLFDIQVSGKLDVIFPDSKTAAVQSAGQLPSGFQPGKLYQSRNHPRNLLG